MTADLQGDATQLAQWLRRQTWPRSVTKSKAITVVDLFCGCGGMTLGAYQGAHSLRRSIKVKFAIDLDPSAVAVYEANFARFGAEAECGDLLDFLPGKCRSPLRACEVDLRRRTGAVDLLLAGPPCQGHSDLNNSSRRHDPRNGLYLLAIRGVEVLRPRWALIENVPTVIHDHQQVVATAQTALEAAGYVVTDHVLPALAVGLPQRRRRHFLLASRGDRRQVEESLRPHRSCASVGLRAFIEDLEDEPEKSTEAFRTPSKMTPINAGRAQYLFKHGLYDLPNHQRPDCHSNGHTYKSMYGRLSFEMPAQTITTGFGCMGQGRYVHPTRVRTLTPHEAARIQGFPDFFRFDAVEGRVALQRVIGNAVPPPLVATIVRAAFGRKGAKCGAANALVGPAVR